MYLIQMSSWPSFSIPFSLISCGGRMIHIIACNVCLIYQNEGPAFIIRYFIKDSLSQSLTSSPQTEEI